MEVLGAAVCMWLLWENVVSDEEGDELRLVMLLWEISPPSWNQETPTLSSSMKWEVMKVTESL